MAYIPDKAILNFHRLTPAEIKVYSFYCKNRSKESGGWVCKDDSTARKMRMSRSRVTEARLSLQNKGWIKCYENHFISVIFGFKVVENSTDFVENSTDFVENSTRPIKGIYQPILPAHLTSSSADSRNGISATAPVHKNGDKKFSEHQPADTKPAPADQPASQAKPAGKPAPAPKPADARSFHPAVQMVKQITGRYPPKELWDKIIRELPEELDFEFFRAAWEVWRSFDGKPTNYEKWLFEPNRKTALPVVFGEKYPADADGKPKSDWVNVGKFRPETVTQNVEYDDAPGVAALDEKAFDKAVLELLDLVSEGIDASDFERYYTPTDWARLNSELKNYEFKNME